MRLEIRKRASNTLADIGDWIDENNTDGAGDRWLLKVMKELNHLATIKAQYAICKNPSLSKYEYRCFTHNDKWVVAYKLVGNKFIVFRFIYGPWQNY